MFTINDVLDKEQSDICRLKVTSSRSYRGPYMVQLRLRLRSTHSAVLVLKTRSHFPSDSVFSYQLSPQH